jgi:hypothetical protein
VLRLIFDRNKRKKETNLTRNLTLLLVFLAASISAFANIGFCPPPATATACSTATGAGGETIAVAGDSVGFFFLGGGGSTTSDPWYLLLAVPNDVGGAPTLTGDATYTIGAATDVGTFLPTTSGSVYGFAAATTGISGGNGSISATNLFCDGASYPCTTSNEISAFGSLPTSFEIFAYSVTPGLPDGTGGSFSASTDLVAGTFLAAIGGKQGKFSTPYTTAGLVTGGSSSSSSSSSSSTGGGPGGGPASGPLVPEPSSIVLLGSALLAVTAGVRKKMIRS